MKLLLNGGGAGEKTTAANKIFSSIIDHNKPLLYVPLAMEKDKYPSCLEWITEEMKNVNLNGIDMVTSKEELASKDLNNYCAIFFGGGNTFKLLFDIKTSETFTKIKDFILNDGICYGGSAGTIIFGEDLESCILDDTNEVNLKDISGFNVLNGTSFLCHYTNRTEKKDKQTTKYLLKLSQRKKVIALPEEDTLYINGDNIEVIGTRPYYIFENGEVIKKEINN